MTITTYYYLLSSVAFSTMGLYVPSLITLKIKDIIAQTAVCRDVITILKVSFYV